MKITVIVLITIIVIGYLSVGVLCCDRDKDGNTSTNKGKGKTNGNKRAVPSIRNMQFDTDYCSKELSCGQKKNIMCNAEAKFGPTCQKASYVPITDKIKSRFLSGHNEKRDFTAQGKLGTNEEGTVFGKAARMATMVWKDELQRMALQDAYQCSMKPHACHRTRDFVHVGVNLAMSCVDLNDQNVEQIIDFIMIDWFNENKNLFLSPSWFIQHGSGHAVPAQFNHFTQMVCDKAFAVGCAIITSIVTKDERDWKCFHVACTYATKNTANRPIYETGPMGSKCKSGKNPNYPGLCSEDEDYYDDEELFVKNT